MAELNDMKKELYHLNENVRALTLELQRTNMILSLQTSLNLMNDAVNIGAINDETYFNFIKANLNDISDKGGQNDSAE